MLSCLLGQQWQMSTANRGPCVPLSGPCGSCQHLGRHQSRTEGLPSWGSTLMGMQEQAGPWREVCWETPQVWELCSQRSGEHGRRESWVQTQERLDCLWAGRAGEGREVGRRVPEVNGPGEQALEGGSKIRPGPGQVVQQTKTTNPGHTTEFLLLCWSLWGILLGVGNSSEAPSKQRTPQTFQTQNKGLLWTASAKVPAGAAPDCGKFWPSQTRGPCPDTWFSLLETGASHSAQGTGEQCIFPGR